MNHMAGILCGLAAAALLAGQSNPISSPPATQPAAVSDRNPPANRRQPPVGLLTPIPEQGGLPPIYSKLYDLTIEEIRHRGVVRDYAKQIRLIRHKHFGEIKVQSIREQGISQLAEFTDPAAFRPMIEELQREKDDVRLAMLDHFAKHGEAGQAALAWVAIHDSEAAIRNEATRRMLPAGSPPPALLPDPIRYVLDSALRSPKHEVANRAASLAGALGAIETIPLLIFAQAAGRENDTENGDIAWIAIQTQRAYVAGLVPVTGDASGAFQPIIGRVSDGVVLRVMDAVVISYRTVVHDTLVAMTSEDWGQPTDQLGYNIKAWWEWYNTKYVPFKLSQARQARLADEK
jgi:hypothetical protein